MIWLGNSIVGGLAVKSICYLFKKKKGKEGMHLFLGLLPQLDLIFFGNESVVRAGGYAGRGSEPGALATPESFPMCRVSGLSSVSVGRPLGEPCALKCRSSGEFLGEDTESGSPGRKSQVM